MSEVDVSVVIITYNQEAYIGMALDSVVNQNFKGTMEVLVGDDCSTDNTGNIVREYGERYPEMVHPVIREKNVGMVSNMGELIMAAKGKYIALLEGDDYWTDMDKLQKQFDFMESHPDYVANFGRSIIVDEHNERQEAYEKYVHFFDGNEFTIKDFQNYQLPGQTCSAFYRKSGFMKMMQIVQGLDFEIKYVLTDRTIVLSMFAAGKIWNSQEFVSAYRYMLDPNSNSWSSKHDYFSYENEKGFLLGLNELEKIAAVIHEDLNFDERRRYEFMVIADKKSELTKEEVSDLRKIIYKTYSNRPEFIKFLVTRKITHVFKK